VVEDYVAMRLSLKAHPVALLRHLLTPGAETQRAEIQRTETMSKGLNRPTGEH